LNTEDTLKKFYNEYEIATSNAFAYLHKNYNPKPFNKLIYNVNSIDKKILSHIEKTFSKINMVAVNILDIDCKNCEDGEQLKEYMNKNNYSCLLKITFTDRMQRRGGFKNAVYSTFGFGTNFSYASVMQDVWAVFEWYNSDFYDIPFLQTQALKSSIKSDYYSLAEGLINLSIYRPIKKGLLIKPK
jgi:hypothetical protein